MQGLDISSRGDYPASALSNFAEYPFIFDGIPCASMEGLLQSFKFEDLDTQSLLCSLSGFIAMRTAQERNAAWKSTQTLWWLGRSYYRHGEGYQKLLDRAYAALYQNAKFRKALLATGDEALSHSVGKSDASDTILTESEFCIRLMLLRQELHTMA